MRSKKTTRSFLSVVFALTLVCSSLSGIATSWAADPLEVSYLTLAPGSDETMMNFSWHTTDRSDSPVVRIWSGTGVAAEFTGTCSTSTSSLSTKYYNRVTVTGLVANTTYTYQLGDGNGNWSIEYSTSTKSSDSFSYLVFGDPQTAAQADGIGWANTLALALAEFPDLAFMASTGDNIDSNTTAQYNYFFTPAQTFSSLPLAVCMGNHEGSSTNPHAFYNPPNADSNQNYWYRYGDVLFLVWNCTTGNAAGMRTFLTNATAANPDAQWTILNFHYDVYGQGSSHALSDGKNYRDSYVAVIDEFDIDVVFNGHDHSYSRSVPMIWSGSASTSNNEGMQPETFDANGASVDPTGTVYFSLNSASGQKYYTLVAKQAYTAAMNQANRPNFSIVDITTSTFTCSTYQVNTDNTTTMIDTYTIVKTSGVVGPEPAAELILSTDKNIVAPNDYFNVSVSFPAKMESNVINMELTFDPNTFEFAAYTPAAGATLLASEYDEGSVALTVMVPDYEMQRLGALMLKAKPDASLGSSEIAVAASFIEKNAVGEKTVKEAYGSYIQKTNNAGSSGFVVDLLVLSNLIDAFGMTSAHADWESYSYFDFNGNNEIDIFDIVTVAKMIK